MVFIDFHRFYKNKQNKNENQWKSMKSNKNKWEPLIFHMSYIDLYWFPLDVPLLFHGISMENQWFSFVLIAFHWFPFILWKINKINQNHWKAIKTNENHWFPVGPPLMVDDVPLSSHWCSIGNLWGINGFHWCLKLFIEFHRFCKK